MRCFGEMSGTVIYEDYRKPVYIYIHMKSTDSIFQQAKPVIFPSLMNMLIRSS